MEERKSLSPATSIIIVLVAVIAVASVVFWFFRARNTVASVRYEKQLIEATNLMFEGGVTTENCANLMQSVWNNSIWKIADKRTDHYTHAESGVFYDDFNDALAALFADPDFREDIKSIRQNRDDVEELIRKLKNPPRAWQDAYSELLRLYDTYYDFTELVLNTHCSLNEFSERFVEYDNEMVKRLDKMDLYFD
ncbi:MAG: hypothetical protein IKX41_01005 [Oscillospiraceae bacterium]|nr:hypothetical protein [Oscillospiraceae bacterium]